MLLESVEIKLRQLKNLAKTLIKVDSLAEHIYTIRNELCKDDIIAFAGAFSVDNDKKYRGEIKFYLPNRTSDFIQSQIFQKLDFFGIYELGKLDKFIPQNATICDIGANIGNHSVYWGKVRNAAKIYAFEPIAQTFKILERNIALNALEGVVLAKNCALGASVSSGKIKSFIASNIGATSICTADEGGGILKFSPLTHY